MTITCSHLDGDTLAVVATGFNPTTAAMGLTSHCSYCHDERPGGHIMFFDLLSLPNRRMRELVPPCDACRAMPVPPIAHVVVVEASAASRADSIHSADECPIPDAIQTGHCAEVSLCTDLTCACCQTALSIIVMEHQVKVDPASVNTLDKVAAKRLTTIGAVARHTWNDKAGKAEAPDRKPGPTGTDVKVKPGPWPAQKNA